MISGPGSSERSQTHIFVNGNSSRERYGLGRRPVFDKKNTPTPSKQKVRFVVPHEAEARERAHASEVRSASEIKQISLHGGG